MNKRVYESVAARANGRCEACGGSGMPFPLELDHFAGRKHASETEFNCWLLCRSCHFAKTNSRPDAAHWFRRFIAHCERRAFKVDPTNGHLLAAAAAKKEMEWRLAKKGSAA